MSQTNTAQAEPLHIPDHRDLLGGNWWQAIPGWRKVSKADFLDYRWQLRNSVTKPERLVELLGGLVPKGFIADMQDGFEKAPMQMRVTPTSWG